MRLVNLISEDNENISLGRVAFWIVFGFIIYSFLAPALGLEYKLPDNLMEVFWGLLSYNAFKKIPFFNGLPKKEKQIILPEQFTEITPITEIINDDVKIAEKKEDK